MTRTTTRKTRKHILARAATIMALLTAGLTGTAKAQSGTYTTINGGVWSDSSNWVSNIIADGADNTATFDLNLTGNSDVGSLDSTRTIGNLIFNDLSPNNSWTLDNNGNAANVLTLDVTSGDVTITSNSLPGRTFTLDMILAGSDNIVLNGEALTQFNQVNTFTGSITVQQGGFRVDSINVPSGSNSPLGNSTSAIVLGDATTGTNDWDVSANIRNSVFDRDLTFANTGSAGSASLNLNASATDITGTITLDRDIDISYGQPGANGQISGLITGTGGIFKTGGTEQFILSNPLNDFSGDVEIFRGAITVAISGTDNALGTGTSPIQVLDPLGNLSRGLALSGSGTLDRDIVVQPQPDYGSRNPEFGAFGSGLEYAGDLTMDGVTDDVLFYASNGTDVEYSGELTGSATMIAGGHSNSGSGNKILFSHSNTNLTGDWNVNNGVIFAGAEDAFGVGNSITFIVAGGVNEGAVFTDASVEVKQDITAPDLPGFTADLHIGGSNAENSLFSGTIDNQRTNANGISLTAGSGGSAEFSGLITGSGNYFIRNNGIANAFTSQGGDVIFSNAANDFTGPLEVQEGRLILAAGGTVLGDSAGTTTVNNGAALGFQGGITLPSGESITVQGNGPSGTGGVVNLSGDNTVNADLTMAANTTFGAEADSLTLKGDLLGGFAMSVTGAGTVAFDGNVTTSGVSTTSGGNIAGNGTIGGPTNVNNGGSINPGDAVGGDTSGTISLGGDLTFQSSAANYNFDLIALDAGFGFDVIDVTGAVDLNSATLAVNLTSPVQKWQKLFIVVNDDTDAIGDEFLGKPQGSLITLTPGNFARISYFGDSTSGALTGGNDVVLYDFATSIPEPATMSLLVLGGLMIGQRRRRQA